jgi:hypothetical protein
MKTERRKYKPLPKQAMKLHQEWNLPTKKSPELADSLLNNT